MAEQFDFYLDADDEYTPQHLPTGRVKMGGQEYTVRCPKDSLPMLLGRIQAQAQEAEDTGLQEDVIVQLVSACFEQEDVADIIERIVSPHDRQFTIAFLLDTVQRVYAKYAPLLEKGYEELGIENPIKQPEDHKASSKKPGAKKAVAKAPAKRTPARA